jgi:hypothetical protein
MSGFTPHYTNFILDKLFQRVLQNGLAYISPIIYIPRIPAWTELIVEKSTSAIGVEVTKPTAISGRNNAIENKDSNNECTAKPIGLGIRPLLQESPSFAREVRRERLGKAAAKEVEQNVRSDEKPIRQSLEWPFTPDMGVSNHWVGLKSSLVDQTTVSVPDLSKPSVQNSSQLQRRSRTRVRPKRSFVSTRSFETTSTEPSTPAVKDPVRQSISPNQLAHYRSTGSSFNSTSSSLLFDNKWSRSGTPSIQTSANSKAVIKSPNALQLCYAEVQAPPPMPLEFPVKVAQSPNWSIRSVPSLPRLKQKLGKSRPMGRSSLRSTTPPAQAGKDETMMPKSPNSMNELNEKDPAFMRTIDALAACGPRRGLTPKSMPLKAGEWRQDNMISQSSAGEELVSIGDHKASNGQEQVYDTTSRWSLETDAESTRRRGRRMTIGDGGKKKYLKFIDRLRGR